MRQQQSIMAAKRIIECLPLQHKREAVRLLCTAYMQPTYFSTGKQMHVKPDIGKILMITEPSGGGSGRHFVDLCRELKRIGHRVHAVYSPVRAEKEFIDELRALDLEAVDEIEMQRSIGYQDIVSAYKLKKLINRHGPYSIVHAHSSKAGAIARMVAPRSAAMVYTPHAFRTMDPDIGAKGKAIYGTIERLLALAATDAVITVSSEEYDHALSIGIPHSKLHVVHNGATPAPSVNRDAIRDHLGISKDQILVGFVGRMTAQKNPLRFVGAVSKASQANRNVKGIMIGDGELFDSVQSVANGELILLGSQEARKFLPAFDLLVMTSNYEAMPYVLIEALHAGLPIVAPTVGGVSSTALHGKNAICLPIAASSDDFSDAIVTVCQGDLLKRYGQQSLELAQYFSAERMAADTLKVYEGLRKNNT